MVSIANPLPIASRPFRANRLNGWFPRLKPWAEPSNPFGVGSKSQDLANRLYLQSRTTTTTRTRRRARTSTSTIARKSGSRAGVGVLGRATREAPVRTEPHPTVSVHPLFHPSKRSPSPMPQRGYRTQPRVSTLGTPPEGMRPEGARDRAY
jgi:hypothetical protein